MKSRILKEWILAIISIIDISRFFKIKRENKKNIKNTKYMNNKIKKQKEVIIKAEEEEEEEEKEKMNTREEAGITKVNLRMKNNKKKYLKQSIIINHKNKHLNKQKISKINWH